jgi:membrane fusion protein (multidrug efflux system)
MKLKHIIYTLLILALGSLIAYRITQNKNVAAQGNDKGGKKPPTTVSGMVATANEFANSLSVSGSIEANEQVEIRSEVSGIVEGIYFKEGNMVNKGQVLFKVNDTELQAQLGQAIAKQELAVETERRNKILLDKDVISREEYDIIQANLKTTQAQTQLIRAQIAKTSYKAPFSGKIGLRYISPGTYLTPNVLVANLVNANPVKITFSIPEKYATDIRLNTEILFSVSGKKEQYTAKIYAIEPNIDASTRTLSIRAMADNKKGNLIPGTFANVVLPLNAIKDAIIIPTEAIIPVQSGKKVFLSKGGKTQEVMVETLTRTENDVIVTSGIKIGDTVLTSGIMSLKNQAPVKVKLKK